MASGIPDTRDKTFEEWAAGVSQVFPEAELGNFPYLPWQEWALQLFQRTTFATIQLPDPLGIASWQEWGDKLRLVTDGLET